MRPGHANQYAFFVVRFQGGLFTFPCYYNVKENSLACIQQLCSSRGAGVRSVSEEQWRGTVVALDFFCEHQKHSVASQYLMYIFK